MTVVAMKPGAASLPAITLRQRIADALTKNTSSAEVRSCLADAQGDIARVARELKHAEAVSCDPLSAEREAEEAERRCEALRSDRNRLIASADRLTARIAEVENAERHEAARPAYESARTELYAAAKAITDEYPVLARKLADLLQRARDAERKAYNLNFNLPETFDKLPALDNLIRDRAAYFASRNSNLADYSPEPSTLIDGVTLPSLDYGAARRGEYLWVRGER